MSELDVIADLREETGKGAVRRLRRTGAVPGVVYGGDKDVTLVKMERHRLDKQLGDEAFFSRILNVRVGGEDTQAVVKAMQRDPTTNAVTHLDFQRVSSSQAISMNVPLHFTNEDDCPGKKAGGVVSHLLVDVEISCLPKDLPEFIEVDMAGMEVGDSLHLSNLVMPGGVTLTALAHDADHDQPVVSIQHPQKLDVEEDEDTLEAGEQDVDGDTPKDAGADDAGGDAQEGDG